MWDATCPDTFAPSYFAIAAQQFRTVAQQAEDKKILIYKHLDSCHVFTLVAIKMSGAFGPRTTNFLKELGHWLRQVSDILHRDRPMQFSCWGNEGGQ